MDAKESPGKSSLVAKIDFDPVAGPFVHFQEKMGTGVPWSTDETAFRKAEKPSTDPPGDRSSKRDKEPLELIRDEKVFPTATKEIKKRERIVKPFVGKPLQVNDKPLIFGGRGFDIQGFAANTKSKIPMGFNRHMEERYPLYRSLKPSGGTKTKNFSVSEKNLIFHPAGSALNRFSVGEHEDPGGPEEKKIRPPDQIPETRLYLPREEDTLLVLRPGKVQLDVLMGNENVNKRTFESWSRP